MDSQVWLLDYRSEGRAIMHRLKRTLASTRSRYQDILIAETEDFGRTLFSRRSATVI